MKTHKVIRLCSFLGSLLIALSSCTVYQGNHNTPSPVYVRKSPDWDILSINVSDVNIQKPAGLVVDGEHIFICDAAANKIVQLSTDLTFENSWGALGNEPGNFIQPSDITVSQNKIYVLDAGNNRIQIFTSPSKVEETLDIFDYVSQNGDTYTNLAVTDSNEIYIATSALGETDRIFSYNTNNNTWDPLSDLYACIAVHGDNVYAINTLEVTKKGNNVTAESGSNALYEYSPLDKRFEILFDFPSMYTISDFIVSDDSVYVLSVYHKRLDRFNLAGAYQETIAEFNDTELFDLDTYLAIDEQGNFYVSDGRNGVLYKIEKNTQ